MNYALSETGFFMRSCNRGLQKAGGFNTKSLTSLIRMVSSIVGRCGLLGWIGCLNLVGLTIVDTVAEL